MKRFIKRILRIIFEFGQHFGIDILPRNFYSEIPLISELKKEKKWKEPFDIEKLEITNLKNQVENFAAIGEGVNKPFFCSEIHEKGKSENCSDGYGLIESGVLRLFVNFYKPKVIIQIGCGVSTSVLLNSKLKDDIELICIEPYPGSYLLELSKNKKINLIKEKVQNVLDIYRLVSKADFLFVDSTHALGPSGEVTRIILEFLPYLKKGATVHFHDIYFPYDYEPGILEDSLFFQHESALLLAFLSYNSFFEVLFSLSYLHFNENIFLTEFFGDFHPMKHDKGVKIKNGHFPSSIYFKKVK